MQLNNVENSYFLLKMPKTIREIWDDKQTGKRTIKDIEER